MQDLGGRESRGKEAEASWLVASPLLPVSHFGIELELRVLSREQNAVAPGMAFTATKIPLNSVPGLPPRFSWPPHDSLPMTAPQSPYKDMDSTVSRHTSHPLAPLPSLTLWVFTHPRSQWQAAQSTLLKQGARISRMHFFIG